MKPLGLDEDRREIANRTTKPIFLKINMLDQTFRLRIGRHHQWIKYNCNIIIYKITKLQ